MALNNFRCSHPMSLHFKGLICKQLKNDVRRLVANNASAFTMPYYSYTNPFQHPLYTLISQLFCGCWQTFVRPTERSKTCVKLSSVFSVATRQTCIKSSSPEHPKTQKFTESYKMLKFFCLLYTSPSPRDS